jgi:hypothetical protein
MKKITTGNIKALALTYFGKGTIADANKSGDPVEHLTSGVSGHRGFGGPIEIVPGTGWFFANTRGGKVHVFGQDKDGNLDWDHPLLIITIEMLAKAALADEVQMELSL